MFKHGTPGDDVYAVILAGGSGTRFWPKSRELRPKQLCALGTDTRTMIEITLARLDGFIPPERRIIVTHVRQLDVTKAIVGARAGIFIAEPDARNTANALAMAALEIAAIDQTAKQPVMISLHSDHLVRDEEAFRTALLTAVTAARRGKLMLIGVVPEYAETGFGYIERGPGFEDLIGAYEVASFREKPDLATAREYLESKNFYWNAGMFVWRVDVIMEELQRTLAPSLARLIAAQVEVGGRFSEADLLPLAAAYKKLPKISIDHAVLETSTNIGVIPANIGWQDIGSWDALSHSFTPDQHGNLLFGDGCMLDCANTTVDTDGPFVATLGLHNHVVVASGGAILVCPKERSQEVRRVVDWLTEKGRRELL